MNLTYQDKGQKPVSWTDTIYLVNTPAGWRVDDIGYGGAWDFGNKGRLSQTLGDHSYPERQQPHGEHRVRQAAVR